MGKFRRIDTEPGWINRKITANRRALERERAAKRLPGSSFPPGSIPSAALIAPSAPGYVYLTATNFALSTTGANVIDSTVLVPEGFTSCVVAMTGRVFAYNSTASPDYLYAQVKVNGLAGNALPVHAAATGAANDSAISASPFATVLTDLVPGATFPLQLFAKTATASWAADVDNTAELTGLIIWFD